MGVMNNFQNINAYFETEMQILGSRSRSQGSTFWYAWKSLVPRHVCAIYQRYTSIGMGVMNNFRNLNADSEVKVKVTGVKMLTCMERSCPKAFVCQILKVYLNRYGSYDQISKPKHRFWNLNADSEVKVKVTGVKILACIERSCPKAHVCQI